MEDCLPLFSASHPRYHTASDGHHLRAVPCGCMHNSTSNRTYSTLTCATFCTGSHASSYSQLRERLYRIVGGQSPGSHTEDQSQFERNPCEICGRRSDTGTSLSPAVLVCLSIIISLILHTHSPVIRCWYDRFTSSRGTNGPPQPRPTDLILYVYYHTSHTMLIVKIFSPNHTNYMLQHDCTIIR